MPQDRDDKVEALEDLMSGDPRRFCAKWLEAIEASSEEEKTWREQDAEQATKAYKGDSSSSATAFNIFHSNIETLVPALYNSQPIPDVRRRFNDDDPVAAQLSELLERALSFSIDDYDFDDVMKNVVKDMAVVDRGVAWVKYEPTFGEDEMVEYEEARCEYVLWRTFRRGPATSWDRVPWIARKHGMSRQEVERLVTEKSSWDDETKAKILHEMTFNVSAEDNSEKGKEASRQLPTFGARTNVWEIWDRDTRSVVWISEDYQEHPLAIMPDPLGLRGFFPTPKPAMIIQSTDSLTPITSYSIYSGLIEELNDISERIKALVKQLRVRGAYAGVIDDIPKIASAGDGELVPLGESELFATTGGGLEKAIVWWPIEIIVQVVKELVAQRDIVKSVIYEVTGLADIIRGATDPNETATAQGIKEKWGSIRVQSHQKEVERYAADLFRLKAEIFCKHFDLQTLLLISGLKYPTAEEKQRAQALMQQGEQMFQQYQQMQQQVQQMQQAGQEPPPELMQQMQQLEQMGPQFQQSKQQLEEIIKKPAIEELEQLRSNDRVLKYRVDIESDSTVRADLSKNQEQLKGFLEGTASYAQSIGPLVQQGAMPGEVAVEIFAAFARNFRLGKQAEDALDNWADKIKKDGMAGKEDPVAQADANLKMAQAESHKATAEKTKIEAQLLPAQFQADVVEKKANLQMAARKNAADDEDRRFNREEMAKGNRAKHNLEVGRSRQADRHHGDKLRDSGESRSHAERVKQMEIDANRGAQALDIVASGASQEADLEAQAASQAADHKVQEKLAKTKKRDGA